MDTDSSNEDSRGSSNETLSAILYGNVAQESTSSDGQNTLLGDGEGFNQNILENM